MTGQRPRSDRGQILPLLALFMVVLIGMAALAVDVSGALSARRFYRSVADGAALAGAQDLQQPGSRAVGAADRINARQHAMSSVLTELGIAGALPGACSTAADVDVTDACILPGTSYHVSIKAGVYAGQVSPIACQECDPARAVQVGLRNASYGLTFSRVLGPSTWSVGVNSVAGLTWAKSYAIVTLRPPAKTGSTYDVKDIKLDGGTHVTVSNGDVATNADMDFSGVGSSLALDPGFNMYYADWTGPSQNWPAPPIGVKIFQYVQDANYRYPAMSGSLGTSNCSGGGVGDPMNCAPTFTNAREDSCGAPSATTACTTPALDPTTCGAELAYLRTSVYTFMATQDAAHVYCYKPGIYDPQNNSKSLSVGATDVVILLPGAYYFKSPRAAVTVNGRLIGGYRPSTNGVALMFDECGSGSPNCVFSGNSALTIALNSGTKYPPGTTGTAARAAIDWNNQLVQTSGPQSPTPPILLSLLVNKDPACVVPAYPGREPDACNAANNKTLNLAGGGTLDVEGVQYAPTDNIEIHGGAMGTGHVGQIWAWTLFYSGGTQINQEGAGSLGPGTLRLDGACTAPGTPCIP